MTTPRGRLAVDRPDPPGALNQPSAAEEKARFEGDGREQLGGREQVHAQARKSAIATA